MFGYKMERKRRRGTVRVSKEATDRGTAVHEFAEQFFNGDDIFRPSQAPKDVIQMTKDLIRITQTGVEGMGGKNKSE